MMRITFELSREDQRKALIELIFKKFLLSIISIMFLSLGVSSFITGIEDSWTKFATSFILTFLILYPICFGKMTYNLYKSFKSLNSVPHNNGLRTILFADEGIIMGTEKQLTQAWKSITRIEHRAKYIHIIFRDHSWVPINKASLDRDTITHLIETIRRNTPGEASTSTAEKSKDIYWLGLLGIIPNVGLISGGILAIMGFIRKDLKLGLIGAAGVLFTPLFWLLFTHFTSNSDAVIQDKIQFTKDRLNAVVKDIELYKVINGQYPDRLADVRNQNKLLSDHELFTDFQPFKKISPATFYYVKNESGFILKSFGPDRVIDTEDDIYPDLISR